MFSQYLKYLLEKSRFLQVVISRFLIILFRKRREVELLYLNYDEEHLFETSYIVINYRFRNALYYKFGAYKTVDKQIKIFDLKNCDKEMDFVVYGLFDSKKYKLTFEPQLTLENLSFKTSFSNLNLRLTERTIPKFIHSKVNFNLKTPALATPRIRIKQPNIKISKTTFNQNEFI